MKLLLWADLRLHRLMHGRCYNPWLCLKLSYYSAMHDEQRGVRLRGPS